MNNDDLTQNAETASEIEYGREGVKNQKGKDYLLPVSVLIAGVMISGSIIYLVLSSKGVPAAGTNNNNLAAIGAGGNATSTGDVSKLESRDVILGSPNAPVTFIGYGDYQCTFCGKFFSEAEPLLVANYVKTNKMRMIFRNFQFLGLESVAAAVSAECAKDQSKFWAYHDALYSAEVADGRENNGNLTRDLFIKLAGNVGMDTKAFADCVDSGKYVNQVNNDTVDAGALGVNSTPTAYVNGRQFLGALPYQQYAAVIDGLLKAK